MGAGFEGGGNVGACYYNAPGNDFANSPGGKIASDRGEESVVGYEEVDDVQISGKALSGSLVAWAPWRLKYHAYLFRRR